ncbi:GNAT family N-acetyltransferase [Sorangium sp. So ce302]|uniref:GNAT family N-acetyltransferase n=1 Tax=Sorangium sp. So ce302 TaxID=3133297 RepID=UPI003F646D37
MKMRQGGDERTDSAMLDGVVRGAQAGDLPGVLELYRDLQPEDAPFPPEPELSALWKRMFEHPGYHLFVVERDAALVACCSLIIIPNLTRGGRPYALLENVVTHREHRRRGFGARVVRHALAEAWEAGCYKVMLMTGSQRPGVHRFYEACGFRADEKTGFLARPGAGR